MQQRVRERPRVALLIETSNRYGRNLLHGVHDWLEHTGRRWSIRILEPDGGTPFSAWLKHWEGDGIIARVDTARIAMALRRTKLPAVDVSAERNRSEFPRVSIDNDAVARLAFAHLHEKRCKYYGYCGDQGRLWARSRGRAFDRALRDAGLSCAMFAEGEKADQSWEQRVNAIASWLARLPKPAGIFASSDIQAQQVIEAGHRAGVVMPDEVAVLGVDDDELVCELCDPALSSIVPNARRTGYEAAALLWRLLRGWRPAEVVEKQIRPMRVVERRSTDALSIADRDVTRALAYIRDHAVDGIRVKEVLATVPMSRTLLERKFLKHLGQSPHKLIKRYQIAKVQELLAETDLPIGRIADMTGFESTSYLSAAFRRETGENPRLFRARQRGKS